NDIIYGDRYFTSSQQPASGAAQLNLETISEQAGFTAASHQSPVDFWLRMEAESFNLKNFNIEQQAIASGGSAIATGGKGEASTKFTGPTGIYNIIVGYYDESDGTGKLQLEIGDGRKDKQTFDWLLDKALKNDNIGVNNFVTRTIRGVALTSGETIKIKGNANESEFIEVDYLDVISAPKGGAFANAEFYNGSLYLASQLKDAEAVAQATSLGGKYLAEATKESAEAYWLDNTLGTTKNLIKVDVAESQFTLLQDKATRSADQVLRVEAEDFTLSDGYKVESKEDFASGKKVIANSGSSVGKASTVFKGESGFYDVFVSYVDNEVTKAASASFGINGTTTTQWAFNGISGQAEYRAVGTQLKLNTGDVINLQGWADSSEKAQIDYIDFVKVTGSSASATVQAPQLSQIFLEAERLSWQGGKTSSKSKDYASGKSLIEAEKQAFTTTTFTGQTGLYNIVVGYADDNGKGTLSASLAGKQLGTWQLAQSKDVVTGKTLATQILLTQGDQFKLSIGDEKVQVDYINFTPYIAPVQASTAVTPTGKSTAPLYQSAILIEAENMELFGQAKAEDKKDFASNNGYVRLEASDKETATATTLFQGETGYYDVIVGYYDGNKGTAALTVKLNETKLDQWQLNQDLGDKSASAQTFATRTVASAVKLTRAESVLQILGQKDGEDKAFVDYIKLVKVEAPATAAVNADKSTNSDIIRGGLGNDTIYGGAGNDLIYGEDEFDNGLQLASESSDVIYGGEGNDTIYGNSGNDIIYGDDASQTVVGAKGGNDRLEGGRGNDRLEGGIGDDRLDGSDAIALGKLEIDILGGGAGADRFILGSSTQSYYLGGGNSDYAIIKDFEAAIDVLQLSGSAGNYQQQQQGTSLLLSNGQDLVAILENTKSLDLNSRSVVFV
ncbi:MAG: hypothetical protein HC800_11870, partial [Phormidesmis sp. RL_2_1]|nr:hypothetical protein [Phormidesmis sp. RL_2_1]